MSRRCMNGTVIRYQLQAPALPALRVQQKKSDTMVSFLVDLDFAAKVARITRGFEVVKQRVEEIAIELHTACMVVVLVEQAVIHLLAGFHIYTSEHAEDDLPYLVINIRDVLELARWVE